MGKDVLFRIWCLGWCPGHQETSYGIKWVDDAFFEYGIYIFFFLMKAPGILRHHPGHQIMDRTFFPLPNTIKTELSPSAFQFPRQIIFAPQAFVSIPHCWAHLYDFQLYPLSIFNPSLLYFNIYTSIWNSPIHVPASPTSNCSLPPSLLSLFLQSLQLFPPSHRHHRQLNYDLMTTTKLTINF